MKATISAVMLLALTLPGIPVRAQPAPAPGQVPGKASAPEGSYRFVLPLDVAVESSMEAIRVCEANGYRVTATVVDMDGVAQLVLRGDGATVHTPESSYQKAYGVITLGPMFGFDTSAALYELVKTNPYAPRLASVRNVMALPGAVAFKAHGAMVGALGIGGAPGGEKDEVCARAGLAKVTGRLPQ
jgi:uncharacterized protein GlcG (DUF336 family)